MHEDDKNDPEPFRSGLAASSLGDESSPGNAGVREQGLRSLLVAGFMSLKVITWLPFTTYIELLPKSLSPAWHSRPVDRINEAVSVSFPQCHVPSIGT